MRIRQNLKTTDCDSIYSKYGLVPPNAFLSLAAANIMTQFFCAAEFAIMKKKRIANRHKNDSRYILENIARVSIQKTSSPVKDAFF